MATEKNTARATPQEILTPQPNGGDQAGVIDQVRELLFGETKRSTEQNLSGLEQKMEAMRASMLERFSEVESRIAELTRETERAQAAAIDDIGSAISQLGATIRNMSGGRKAH
jgi:hypothetical protein